MNPPQLGVVAISPRRGIVSRTPPMPGNCLLNTSISTITIRLVRVVPQIFVQVVHIIIKGLCMYMYTIPLK